MRKEGVVGENESMDETHLFKADNRLWGLGPRKVSA